MDNEQFMTEFRRKLAAGEVVPHSDSGWMDSHEFDPYFVDMAWRMDVAGTANFVLALERISEMARMVAEKYPETAGFFADGSAPQNAYLAVLSFVSETLPEAEPERRHRENFLTSVTAALREGDIDGAMNAGCIKKL